MSPQLPPVEFNALWREFHAATDPHDRYRLRSLLVWHTPAPWLMRTFLDRKPGDPR